MPFERRMLLIPEVRYTLKGRPQTYPFADLKLGEAFFIPKVITGAWEQSQQLNRVRTSRRYWEGKTGFKFYIQHDGKEIIVQRIS